MKALTTILQSILLAVFFYVFIVLFLCLAPQDSYGQQFDSLDEANAHFNACLATDWQVRHYDWNICAANVSIKDYGLLLFGHKDSINIYNLHNDSPPTGNWRWSSLELATGGWQRCAVRLAFWQEHARACHAYTDVLNAELAQTSNEEVIPFVASRTVLSRVMGWKELYRPSEPIAPEPNPVEPECAHTEDMIDGGGGSVWKPISESNGRPVILMPQSYCEHDMEVWDSEGTLIETAKLSDCSENGPRGHWRLNRACGFYPDNLILRFGSECRTVPDPCKRYD